MTNKTKSGFIAIVGRPNVGKSTLINQIMNEKIAIISDKPQTTRHRILGVLTKDNTQIVFIDTPGMHKGTDLINKQIDNIAVSTLKDVDAAIFIVDNKLSRAEEHIIEYFKKVKIPIYLVINKIDLLNKKTEIDEIILSYINTYDYAGFYPISALNNTNVDRLLTDIANNLDEGPFYYPSDYTTDQSDKTLMAEFIREKILELTEQEVPHAAAVVIERMNYNKKQKTLDVGALVVVEKSTQKMILLGKDGSKIKEIGRLARLDINKKFDIKTHLDIWIKVKNNWRNNPNELLKLGITDE